MFSVCYYPSLKIKVSGHKESCPYTLQCFDNKNVIVYYIIYLISDIKYKQNDYFVSQRLLCMLSSKLNQSTVKFLVKCSVHYNHWSYWLNVF